MSTAQNELIERLPRKDRAHLLGLRQEVQLLMGSVLCEPAERRGMCISRLTASFR